MTIWQRPNDFDHLSWDGTAKCFNCGSTKRKTEEAIFRPATFDDMSGFPDLCEGCVVEAAAVLGLVVDNSVALKDAQHEFAEVLEVLRTTREALAAVTRENVRLQEVLDDFTMSVEEPYSEDMLVELEDGNA